MHNWSLLHKNQLIIDTRRDYKENANQGRNEQVISPKAGRCLLGTGTMQNPRLYRTIVYYTIVSIEL